MDVQPEAEETNRSEKIYTNRAILASTFLAGPITGGYMLFENFRVLGEKKRAKWSLGLSAAGTVLLLIAFSTIPFLEKIPSIVFPAIYTWIAYFVIRACLAGKMDLHFRGGGEKVGLGEILLVAFASGMITFALAFGVFYVFEKNDAALSIKTYGPLKHEIGYDASNLNEAEVDRIARALTETTYFDREFKKTVDVKKDAGKYELFLYCADSIETDAEAIGFLTELRGDLQKLFPDIKIVINLVIDTQENVVKRLE